MDAQPGRAGGPLILSRRFLPLFIAQALGALNDNILKGAVVVLAVFAGDPAQGATAAMLAGGILVLPFLLFSAIAGELADRYPKPLLIRRLKLLEIPIALFGGSAFIAGHVELALAVLFLTGTQSTLFGPLKYGALPELVDDSELVAANGLVEASTFLAILLGTMLGSVLIALPGGPRLVAAASLAVALVGYVASLFVPDRPAAAPELRIRIDPWRAARDILADARAHRELWRTMLAISWFWAVGGVYLAQIPAYARAELGVGERTATLLLSTFVLGIAAGAISARVMVGGRITRRPVPWSMAAVGLLGLDLLFATGGIPRLGEDVGIAAFLAADGVPRLLVDLLGLAFAGGLFAVPLYAYLQHAAGPRHRGRIIAANNILNAIFLVVSAGLGAAALAAGLSVLRLLAVTALCNLLVAVLLWIWLRRQPL